jgi:hypothetical protein
VVSVILPWVTVNLLIIIGKIQPDITVNPTIIGGLITLSGILFGFVTHTAVSRQAPAIIYVMLLSNLIFFYYLAIELFFAAMGEGSWLKTLTWSISSVLSNFVTAGGILMFEAFARFRRRVQSP